MIRGLGGEAVHVPDTEVRVAERDAQCNESGDKGEMERRLDGPRIGG